MFFGAFSVLCGKSGLRHSLLPQEGTDPVKEEVGSAVGDYQINAQIALPLRFDGGADAGHSVVWGYLP